MGNLSTMVPTIKAHEFNRRTIATLIADNFPKAVVHTQVDHDMIDVYMKGDDPEKKGPIFHLYFNQDKPYFYEEGVTDEDRKYLSEKELKSYQYFFDKGYTKFPTFEYTHAIGLKKHRQLKHDIERFLHGYFKAYVFDEGIHPEHIAPNYVWKDKVFM